MTFDPVKGHMTYAGWVIDHCDQVSLKSIKAALKYIRLYGWQKKKKKKKELESASASRHWYTGAANIDICFLMTSENVL